MIRLTAGNDTPFIWMVKLQGQPFDLSGKDVKVYVINSRGEIPVANLNIEGNRVSGVFEGRYQTRLGMHSLALRVNEGRPEMKTATVANAFELVQWSADAGGSEAGDVIFAPVVITSELRIGTGGGGEGGSYDDTLLWEALDNKVDKVDGKGLSSNDYTNEDREKLASLENYDDAKLKEELSETYQPKGDYVETKNLATINGKPLNEGGNIKIESGSGGASIEVDSSLSTTSTNPVQNKVITAELNKKAETGAIPTKLSQLTDNVGFAKQADVEAGYQPKGDYVTDDKLSSKGYATEKYVDDALEGKQGTIEDLDSIRSGAGKGATAVQPSTLANYATTQQLTELSAEVGKKQDTITDLENIRSGAEKGATAIQEVKTINGQSIVGSGNIDIQGGGGGTPSGNDTELLRMLAGNSPHVIWEDIYGKIHLDVGELKARKGQNDTTFRTTARKIIAASFDTTSTDWTFFFGIQTEIQDSTIEEIYPYAFNDKKVTGFSWPFSCMPNVKDWSFIKYIDTSQCTYLYGVFNRANADKIDISHWDTSNVTSMDCTNSNFFGWTKNVIGLENWDTSKVTSIKNMFAYTGMESISGVSQWDVRKCQNLYGAFGRSTSLKSIDLSKWEIPEGADMGNMFIVCSVLETIGLPNIPSSAKTSNMLNYCYALKNVYMREGALIYASLNLNESSSLSAASVKVILSHLAETPDDGATITFASSLYSRYTAEDKAEIDTLRESAKANGWTIVNMG